MLVYQRSISRTRLPANLFSTRTNQCDLNISTWIHLKWTSSSQLWRIYIYTYIFIHTYTCSVWSGQRYRAAGEILLWIKDIYIYKHVGWRHLISSHLYSWKLSNMRCLFGRVIHRMINFYEVPYIIIDPKKTLNPIINPW